MFTKFPKFFYLSNLPYIYIFISVSTVHFAFLRIMHDVIRGRTILYLGRLNDQCLSFVQYFIVGWNH